MYTERELEVVNPEVVLLLGNSPLKGLLKTSGITKKRGAAIEREGRIYFPTFHPSYILRDPTHEQEFRSDLLAFARLVAGKNEVPKTEVTILRTAEDLDARMDYYYQLPEETPVALDVETHGPALTIGNRQRAVMPWAQGGRLDTIALVHEPEKADAIPLEHPEHEWDLPLFGTRPFVLGVYDGLRLALSDNRLVGHNIKYDLQWLASRGVDLTDDAWFDTMLAAHLLDENRSKGLKPLARAYLGADLYEDQVDWKLEVNPLEPLATYNGQDTDYTLRLYHVFRDELREKPRLARLFSLLVMPAMRAFTRIEARGFPVDVERLIDRHREVVRRLRAVEDRMLEYVPLDDGLSAAPNYRSHPFVARVLYEHLGLPIITVTEKGAPATDEKTLLTLSERYPHPFMEMLLEHRGLSKWGGTYTGSWHKRLVLSGDDRIYPSYNLAGTVTGRLSSDFQQVPRDPFIRSIIGFGNQPDRGWSLLEGDFSQIELRIAAALSGDPTMMAVYERGEDLHALTASTVTGKPLAEVTKDERSRAKAVNFGFLYGMGARNFRDYARFTYGVRVSEDEAIAYRQAFFDRYPRLVSWHQSQRRLVHQNGQVESPLGRVRRLPAVRSGDPDMRAEAERQAINSPVQGLASDFTLLGIVELERMLDQSQARVLGNLHDSIILEVRDDVAQEMAATVKHVMEHLPTQRLFGYTLPVPVVADVKVSKHWGGD